MNATSQLQQPRAIKWEWGKDLENCLGAARETTDPAELACMVDDITWFRFDDETGEVSEVLIRNKHVPFQKAKDLSSHWGEGLDTHLCDRDDAPPYFLAECSKYHDPGILKNVVRHPNAKMSLLDNMRDGSNPFAIMAATCSGRYPESDLEEFVKSEDEAKRMWVAIMTCDVSLLKKMANDEHVKVRIAVAENPDTEVKVVEMLALQNDSCEAQVVAARRTRKLKVLLRIVEHLNESKNKDIAKAIKRNPIMVNTAQLSPKNMEKVKAAWATVTLLT